MLWHLKTSEKASEYKCCTHYVLSLFRFPHKNLYHCACRALPMQILLACLLNMGFTPPSWAALLTSSLEGKLHSLCIKPAIAVRKTSTLARRPSWRWWRRRSRTTGRSTPSCSPSSPASSSSSQASFDLVSSSISSHCRSLPGSPRPRQSLLPAVRWKITIVHFFPTIGAFPFQWKSLLGVYVAAEHKSHTHAGIVDNYIGKLENSIHADLFDFTLHPRIVTLPSLFPSTSQTWCNSVTQSVGKTQPSASSVQQSSLHSGFDQHLHSIHNHQDQPTFAKYIPSLHSTLICLSWTIFYQNSSRAWTNLLNPPLAPKALNRYPKIDSIQSDFIKSSDYIELLDYIELSDDIGLWDEGSFSWTNGNLV